MFYPDWTFYKTTIRKIEKYFEKPLEFILGTFLKSVVGGGVGQTTYILFVLDRNLYELKVLAVINSKIEQAFDCS